MYWALSGLSIGLSKFKTVSFCLKIKSILNMKKKEQLLGTQKLNFVQVRPNSDLLNTRK